MARKRNRRKATENRNNLIKLAASTAIVSVIGFMAYQSMGQPEMDPETHCYEELVDDHTAVFLDVSYRPWEFKSQSGERRRNDIRQIFRNFYDHELGFNEKLTVFTSETDHIQAIPKERFTLCRPAKNSGNLAEIGVSQNAVYTKKQFKATYDKTITPFLDEVLVDYKKELTQVSNRGQQIDVTLITENPLMQYIRHISRMPSFSKHASKRRLYIVSSMIQISEELKMCYRQNHLPSWENWKKTEAYKRLKPDSLQGVEVVIYMLIKDNYGRAEIADDGTKLGLPFCTESEIRNFWTAYFEDAGAASVQIERLID